MAYEAEEAMYHEKMSMMEAMRLAKMQEMAESSRLAKERRMALAHLRHAEVAERLSHLRAGRAIPAAPVALAPILFNNRGMGMGSPSALSPMNSYGVPGGSMGYSSPIYFPPTADMQEEEESYNYHAGLVGKAGGMGVQVEAPSHYSSLDSTGSSSSSNESNDDKGLPGKARGLKLAPFSSSSSSSSSTSEGTSARLAALHAETEALLQHEAILQEEANSRRREERRNAREVGNRAREITALNMGLVGGNAGGGMTNLMVDNGGGIPMYSPGSPPASLQQAVNSGSVVAVEDIHGNIVYIPSPNAKAARKSPQQQQQQHYPMNFQAPLFSPSNNMAAMPAMYPPSIFPLQLQSSPQLQQQQVRRPAGMVGMRWGSDYQSPYSRHPPPAKPSPNYPNIYQGALGVPGKTTYSALSPGTMYTQQRAQSNAVSWRTAGGATLSPIVTAGGGALNGSMAIKYKAPTSGPYAAAAAEPVEESGHSSGAAGEGNFGLGEENDDGDDTRDLLTPAIKQGGGTASYAEAGTGTGKSSPTENSVATKRNVTWPIGEKGGEEEEEEEEEEETKEDTANVEVVLNGKYEERHHEAATKIQAVARGRAVRALSPEERVALHPRTGRLGPKVKKISGGGGEADEFQKKEIHEAEENNITTEVADIATVEREQPVLSQEKELETTETAPVDDFSSAEVVEAAQAAVDESSAETVPVVPAIGESLAEAAHDVPVDETTTEAPQHTPVDESLTGAAQDVPVNESTTEEAKDIPVDESPAEAAQHIPADESSAEAAQDVPAADEAAQAAPPADESLAEAAQDVPAADEAAQDAPPADESSAEAAQDIPADESLAEAAQDSPPVEETSVPAVAA